MRTIGLIGGLSWQSTLEYYRIINQTMAARLGDLHSAEILMHSVDFAAIAALQEKGHWEEITEILGRIAERLETAGADLLIICSNTTHRIADDVAEKISIPLLHIADTLAAAIMSSNINSVGLLGTVHTLGCPFYAQRLEKAGIKVIMPDPPAREIVNAVIYKELCKGEIREASRAKLIEIIADLQNQGVKGIVLGCTELPLLIRPEDVSIPLFDTLRIHAEAAAIIGLGACRGT
jgi:aspartate racemase